MWLQNDTIKKSRKKRIKRAILPVLLLIFLLAVCQKSIELKDECKEESISASQIPDVTVIVYLRYEITSEPVIDLYTGYNIEDSITAPDMKIEQSLDGGNSKLNVKLTKGLWSEELSINATLVDNNTFPMIYTCQDDGWKENIFDITIYEDGSMYYPKHRFWGGWNGGNHIWYWDGYPAFSYSGKIGDEIFFFKAR